MDLVRDYETDDSDSEQPQQCVQTATMDRNAVRSVYLLTYSQANIEKFRTRHNIFLGERGLQKLYL